MDLPVSQKHRNDMIVVKPSTGDKSVELVIYQESKTDSLIQIEDEEAREYGEASAQLQEGCRYSYEISKNYQLDAVSNVIHQFPNPNINSGSITPGNFTGTLIIPFSHKTNVNDRGSFKVEVRSKKTTYRKDYRTMLGEIADQCIELILKHSSPVVQNLIPDYDLDPRTLYQKFAFISSIIGSEDFQEYISRIINSPVTNWKIIEKETDIRNAGRIDSQAVRQIISARNRIPVPEGNPLHSLVSSLPNRITTVEKHGSLDTPENQFVKFVITEYFVVCSEISQKLISDSREKKEAEFLTERLRNILDHPLFKQISSPQSVVLNSPVLQRKEGYREIYRSWLMFDLASKLIWQGGDDVYSAGKKDVAILYEYWVYFKLINLVGSLFSLNPDSIENLIEKSTDNLNLNLKAGKYTPVRGTCDYLSRKLNVELSYNRTFSGTDKENYPQQGSWTRSMRPDYTLSIWPSEFSLDEAENQELMIHIHFDAKYKVDHLKELFGPDSNATENEIQEILDEENHGVYKRNDLLKMHTYKDAIRRTAGAYIIYPGEVNKRWKGFHEIIPGLGAFTIRPDKADDGSRELADFIKEVVQQLLNRASQHEQLTYHVQDTFSSQLVEVNELLPEFVDGKRSQPPAELFVLIGYCKNIAQHEWITQNGLYNARLTRNRGINKFRIKPEQASSSYLLLHQSDELITGNFWKIKQKGPVIFTRDELIKKEYPDPMDEYYLVYEIEPVIDKAFEGVKWDVRKLKGYKGGSQSARPFAVTLSELMMAKV